MIKNIKLIKINAKSEKELNNNLDHITADLKVSYNFDDEIKKEIKFSIAVQDKTIDIELLKVNFLFSFDESEEISNDKLVETAVKLIQPRVENLLSGILVEGNITKEINLV